MIGQLASKATQVFMSASLIIQSP